MLKGRINTQLGVMLQQWRRVDQKVRAETYAGRVAAKSTQPCIPPGSINRVPCSFGWGEGGNVTSAGWQVTLCDPVWHVISRSGVATLRTAIHLLLTYLLIPTRCCAAADRRTDRQTDTRSMHYAFRYGCGLSNDTAKQCRITSVILHSSVSSQN